MTDGLTPGNYGWSMTVTNLKNKCPPEVELRFVAIVLPELFQGLDFDEELWPYPFTPECLLLALQRALGRENHLTRSNKENDLAVLIIHFFKLFTRKAMLRGTDPTSLTPNSTKSSKMLRKTGLGEFSEAPVIESGLERNVSSIGPPV